MLARGRRQPSRRDAMVYGQAGLGVINGTNSWGVGGWCRSYRCAADRCGAATLLGTGAIGSGLDRAKVTGGLVWHMQ